MLIPPMPLVSAFLLLKSRREEGAGDAPQMPLPLPSPSCTVWKAKPVVTHRATRLLPMGKATSKGSCSCKACIFGLIWGGLVCLKGGGGVKVTKCWLGKEQLVIVDGVPVPFYCIERVGGAAENSDYPLTIWDSHLPRLFPAKKQANWNL